MLFHFQDETDEEDEEQPRRRRRLAERAADGDMQDEDEVLKIKKSYLYVLEFSKPILQVLPFE